MNEFAGLYQIIYGRSLVAPFDGSETHGGLYRCCDSIDHLLERLERLRSSIQLHSAVLAPFADDTMLMQLQLLDAALSRESRPGAWRRRYCAALDEADRFQNGTLTQFDGLEILRAYRKKREKICSAT